jgi:hypothetical protein
MPLESFEQRALLYKVETVENTDAVPTGALNAVQFLNGQSGIASEKLERSLDRPYFAGKPFVPVGIYGFIEGEIELIGAAAAGQASPLGPVLRTGGMSEALVVGPPALTRYAPISSGIPSGTGYFHHGGTRKILTGARAKIDGIELSIKKYAMAKVRIEGNCTDCTEQAFPTPDYAAFGDPVDLRTETMALSINGFNVDGLSVSLDLNSELKVKEHTEARVARISDREPTGVVRFYRPTFASLNPWTLWRNQTKVPIVATLDNGVAAKKIKLTIGFAQLEEPKEVEVERDIAYECAFRALTSVGGDEFSIEFGG